MKDFYLVYGVMVLIFNLHWITDGWKSYKNMFRPSYNKQMAIASWVYGISGLITLILYFLS
jgi:hypothetical protein